MIATRREVLAALAVGAAALAFPLPAWAKTGRKVGLQLYTVRNIFEPHPVGTLKKVAEIGYKEVEFGGGGYDKMDAAMLRRAMDAVGLVSPSIHVGYDELLSGLDAAAVRAKTLGAHTIVLPYMTKEHFSAEAWTKAVANMNRFGEALKKQGLGFAYHNHHFEFLEKPDGVSLFDRFMKDRDPALIGYELDLFWAVKAGEDPKALIRRLAGTIFAYHVKDMKADGSMTSVGAGSIDFADIFTLNALAGVKHFYVENDQSPEPYLPDITASFAATSKLLARS